MPIKPLRILEWNVGKRRAAQHSLLNYEETNNFDMLLLAEPYRFYLDNQITPKVIQHHYWEAAIPTQFNKTAYQKDNFRSMIYINKRLQYRQIPIENADLTAVTIKRGQTTILVVAVYAVYSRTRQQRTQELQSLLQAITAAWQKVQQQTDKAQLLVMGDFNRHDMVWGGAGIALERLGEGEPILDFMMEHQLYSALPRGTITFCNEPGTSKSTIDLALVPMQLQHRVRMCQISETDHGSDHNAIELVLETEEAAETLQRKYRSYNIAN